MTTIATYMEPRSLQKQGDHRVELSDFNTRRGRILSNLSTS